MNNIKHTNTTKTNITSIIKNGRKDVFTLSGIVKENKKYKKIQNLTALKKHKIL